ncbi:peptidase M23 [Arthrobacter stackebrandtii]|nr:peptidase M23 [Arthrobacter stackebrandtii]
MALLCAALFLSLIIAPSTTAAVPLPASLAWGWPLAGKPAVANAFDPPAKPWLAGHRGVDLAAEQDAAVLAPSSGVVTFSGVVVNRGVLTIAEPGGLRISLEPVVSELRAGDAVVKGQQLGVLQGPTHCDGAGATCLHWGVRRGEEYLDPLQFIMDLRPSILLPLS